MTTSTVKWNGDEFLRDLESAQQDGLEASARTLVKKVGQMLNLRASHKSAGGQPSPPGSPPARKTGTLARSVIHSVEGNTAFVGIASDSPASNYAMIHEFGGRIEAKNAPFLMFQLPDGDWRRVKFVNMPARPYLRPALNSSLPELREVFTKATRRSLKQKGWI